MASVDQGTVLLSHATGFYSDVTRVCQHSPARLVIADATTRSLALYYGVCNCPGVALPSKIIIDI